MTLYGAGYAKESQEAVLYRYCITLPTGLSYLSELCRDCCRFYLKLVFCAQEELPGNNAIDNAAAVEGLTSIYWCHQMDDAKEVWIDEGENI